MPWPSKLSLAGALASAVVHYGVFIGLVSLPKPLPRPTTASSVEFEVKEPEQPELPATPPPPEPEPPERVNLIPASVRAAPPPAAAPEPEPTPNQPVADLTGLTLTNDSGSAGWGSEVGNGQAITGPLRTRTRQTEPRAVATIQPERPRPAAASAIALADLSERPVPPKLDSQLARYYPVAARQQGKSGDAIVRLRIEADGQVRLATIVSESEQGFGSACRSSLVGSKWTPPRDKQGTRVATFVSYTCHFRANR